jgi:hypothetical protein
MCLSRTRNLSRQRTDMASEDGLQELIKIQPFLGIDSSTNELLMKPGFALSANNVNTSIIRGAMLPERGRTELFDASAFDFGGDTMTSITILYPVVGPDNAPGVLFQGVGVGSPLLTGYYDYNSFTFTNITNGHPFTQAVQFMNVVYTNGGQRFFVGQANSGGPGTATQMFSWQYPAPVVTYRELTSPGVPNPTADGISVLWLYAIAILGFNGAIQQNDILTMTFTIPGDGTFSITYGVGTTAGSPDDTFEHLSANLAHAINLYFTTGSGAAYPNKLTAIPYTNFDIAANPTPVGTINPANAIGVLLSSNAEGNIGATYTITVSMSAGATEGFYLQQQPTAVTQFPTSGTFFRETGSHTGDTPVVTGNMLGGYYFYLFTRVTTMPDLSVSETSVVLDAQATSFQSYPPIFNPNFFPAAYDDPLQVTVGGATYGSNSSVSFLNGNNPLTSYQWTGTNADGSTFTTNIYRASSLQTNFQYQLVGNVSSPDTTPNAVRFSDTFSDLEISGNAVLVLHRDPPPFVAPVHTIDHTQTYNFGFMAIHQNRIFALVAVNTPITATQNGIQYIYQQPQIQLWWSNLARGWEFDLVAQVALLNADVVADILSQRETVGGVSYLGPNYDAPYGNMPKALAEVGTELMAVMKRENWVTWGDGTPQNPYIAKKAFCYGALASSTGVLAVRGGMYLVTESGDLYWYDGSAPLEKSTDINAAIKLTPLGAGFNYSDLGQSCLSFSNDNLYWSFPTKSTTFSYDTSANTWMSTLPYAPTSRYAVATSPWNPATLAGLLPNEVLATRTGLPTVVDQWFSNPNGDAGIPYQLYSWTTPHMDSGHDDWTKWYALVRVKAPKQQGIVTVSITIDNGDEPQQTFSRSFDLSGSQKSLTKKFMGDTQKIIGYYARMTISVQSIPGQPAPIIWGVSVYGSINSRLRISDGGA